MHDIRSLARAWRTEPAVLCAVVLSLGLGIGANTAIFTILNALLLRPLPVPEPHRLVTISSESALHHGFTAGHGWNYPMWVRLQERAEVFEAALAWLAATLDLADGGERLPAHGLFVSRDYFATLGITARAGRLFVAADKEFGEQVAVISDRFWQRRFNRSPDAIGSILPVEGVPFSIIGVTPAGFGGMEIGRPFDIALPLDSEPMVRGARSAINSSNSFLLSVALRLDRGQSPASATAALRSLQPELVGVEPHELANVLPRFLAEPFVLVPASTGTAGGSGLRQAYVRPLFVLLVLAGLLMTLGALNVANMLLGRAVDRRAELGVRLALGAPRWWLVRRQLLEGTMLCALGASGGLVLSLWAVPALVSQVPVRGDALFPLSLDWRVLAFTAGITAAAMLLVSVPPAFFAVRTRPIQAIKERRRRAMPGRAGAWVSQGLVIAQVGLALPLVVAAGLFVRTFERLASQPLGFDADHLLIVDVDTARIPLDGPARAALYHRLIDALAAAPGVGGAAGSFLTPLSEASNAPLYAQPEAIPRNAVTPGWFDVYGMDVRAGRDFTLEDTASVLPVAIVSHAWTRRFAPDRDPIGETVQDRVIVGVASDAVFGSVQASMRPTVYVPLAQAASMRHPNATTVSISVQPAMQSPTEIARTVSAVLRGASPHLSFSIRPMQHDVTRSTSRARLIATLSGVSGGLALLLAAVGLYGVTSHAVNRQRQDIGIRLSLGCPPNRLLRLVLARASLLVAAGVIAGVPASVWLSRYVASLLYGIDPHDGITLGASATLLALIGVASAWEPARRAARTEPAEVMRRN